MTTTNTLKTVALLGLLSALLIVGGQLLAGRSGMYFGLDAMGTRIWQLCQEHGSIRSVWQAIQNEFDVSADTLHADLLSFLDELSAKGLVTIQ